MLWRVRATWLAMRRQIVVGCRGEEVLQSVKSVEAEQVHIGKITFDGVRKHVLGDQVKDESEVGFDGGY